MPMLGLGIALPSMPAASAASAAIPQTGDLIAIEVLGATPIVTVPTNTIVPDGRVVALTFKGLAAGLTRSTLTDVQPNLTLQVSYAGFSPDKSATTRSEVIVLNDWLRMPFPKAWASGQSPLVGEWRSNRVSSRGYMYKCTGVGGGTTSTAPTHTSGSVTGADGYTWQYLGNPTDSTSASTAAPEKLIETVSGSDIIVYGVLSKSITADATITGVVANANLYGASRSCSNPSWLTKTHSQTILAPKPYIVPLTRPFQLLKSGETMRLESVVWHHTGQLNRTVAAHAFRILDSTGALVTEVLSTSMAASTLVTGGKTVQCYGTTIDPGALGLAAGLYYVEEKAYPFRGRAYDTGVDGYGVSLPTSTFFGTFNTTKRWYFRYDPADTIPRRYAYVNGVGGGTPAISTNPATARANPYATVEAARAALNASSPNLNAAVIRVMDKGSDYTDFGGSLSSGTFGEFGVTLEIDPLATPGSVTFAPTTTTNNLKTTPARGVVRGLRFVCNGSTAAVTGQISTAGLNNCVNHVWWESCEIVGVTTAAQAPYANPGLIAGMVNCTLKWMGSNFGGYSNAVSGIKLIAGCNIIGGTAASQVGAVAMLGNTWTKTAGGTTPVPCPPNARYWGENTGSQTNPEMSVIAFNEIKAANANFRAFNGQNDGSTNYSGLTRGAVFVGNLLEVADTDSSGTADTKGGEYSGDSVATPLPELHFFYNTIVGDGPNICYNDTAAAAKYCYAAYNLMDDDNYKGDYYDPTTASETKVGNIFVRYKVDMYKNVVYGPGGSYNGFMGPGNNAGECLGQGDRANGNAVIVRTFTDDKSFFSSGAKTGGGDYHPTGTNSAIGIVSANENMLPLDLDGGARATSSAGAGGALEAA